MQTITLTALIHRNKERMGIFFAGSQQLNTIIKKLPGIRWSQTHKCWHNTLSRDTYTQLVAAIGNKATINNSQLKQYLQHKNKTAATAATVATAPATTTSKPAAMHTTLQRVSRHNMQELALYVQQLKLKAYSHSTIKTYRNEFCQLLQTLQQKPVDTLTPEQLKRYMLYAMEKEGISENTAHSRLNALKFYFEQVLGQDSFFWSIPRPKKKQPLPKVFSQDDIAAIIKSVTNKKHKTMLMLAYSAGLRVSEVVHLKTYHINGSRMSILIEAAKGKKDRLVTLSPVLLIMLREYAKQYKPDKQGWLFEGNQKGTPYSSRSLQEVLQQAKKKAGIIRPGSIHSLRHSFATHLIEKGTDVTMIQKLLGHSDLKTTMIYLHTSNKDLLKIISPLDDLQLD